MNSYCAQPCVQRTRLRRANVGGISGEGRAPARAWDGDAAPLTQSFCRKNKTVYRDEWDKYE